MKGLGRSFLMAFSGYSISPKTQLERNKENCSWVLVWLPIIGAIITAVINRWAVAYPYLCNYQILPAVIGAVLPSILSGGAHLDGFFRTVDALCSHKSREEKIKILSEDAHGGYSAIIVCICYFMMAFGVWSEMPIDGIYVIAFAYIISRSLYGISVLTMKHSGANKCDAYVPDSKGVRIAQIIINIVYIVICAVLMYEISVFIEKPSLAIACFIGAVLSYLYYAFVAVKHFGGVSEEVGSFFIMICEVVIPIAALIAFKRWF